MPSFLKNYSGYLILGVIVLVGLTVAGVTLAPRQFDAQRQAEATLAAAQNGLKVALADATTRDRLIVQLTVKADSAGQKAVVAQRQAKVIKDSLPGLRAKLDSALHDSTAILAARAYESATTRESDSLEAVIVDKTAQVGDLRAALDSARKSVVVVSHAAVVVDTAATAVVQTLKKPFLLRISPKLGFGAAVGVDLTGKPNVVIGATLSWPR